jgi:hypothetical protein
MPYLELRQKHITFFFNHLAHFAVVISDNLSCVVNLPGSPSSHHAFNMTAKTVACKWDPPKVISSGRYRYFFLQLILKSGFCVLGPI